MGQRPRFGGFSIRKLLTGSAYKKRWFVLDVANHRLRYYRDASTWRESGFVDLKCVDKVIPSMVFDAPNHSVDLVGPEKHYTFAAESGDEMLRWATAIYILLEPPKHSRASLDLQHPTSAQSGAHRIPAKTKSSDGASTAATIQSHNYSFTYLEEGPLMINIAKDANNEQTTAIFHAEYLIRVESFKRHPDGRAGASEVSGIVSEGDYIVGVNDVDLSQYASFKDAMEAVRSAAWPKTLHFVKASESMPGENMSDCKVVVYIESYAKVACPAWRGKKRLMISLAEDNLYFSAVKEQVSGQGQQQQQQHAQNKKAAEGAGSEGEGGDDGATSTLPGRLCLPLASISGVAPVTVASRGLSSRYTLRIACKSKTSLLLSRDQQQPGSHSSAKDGSRKGDDGKDE